VNKTANLELKECIRLKESLKRFQLTKLLSAKLKFLNYSIDFMERYDSLPKIYIISTVSLSRATELADLTRMVNTLRLVPKLCWILVEKSVIKSEKLAKFLENLNLEFIHLNKEIEYYEHHSGEDIEIILQNFGLDWLRKKSSIINLKGVVHFLKIENSYDKEIFEEVCLSFIYILLIKM
jgi:hypothetical protein